MKKFIVFVIGLIIITTIFIICMNSHSPTVVIKLPGYENTTYIINGEPITLVNGYQEELIGPGSDAKRVTKYFGNEAEGDLNGDDQKDVAFYLTQDGGGSGTFYYLVASLKVGDGYKGTDAILIGDRIAPDTTQIKNGEIIANYVDRKPGEPMSTQPSVGVTKHFRVQDGKLVSLTSNNQ